MRANLSQWVKANSVLFVNVGSLVGTTGVTSVLGFLYWWFAARQFPPAAVGLASAAISAMTLIGTLSMLGLGTLLMGELPRQKGKEASLISASLILVGGVGGAGGIVFAVIGGSLSADLHILGASAGTILLFATGVSFSAISILLDQALIGLLRGGLQLWRNTLFALTKLAVLLLVSSWVSSKAGLAVYATWIIGNGLSFVALAAFVLWKRGWQGRTYLPEWRLLRRLGRSALQHHALNVTLLAPGQLMTVLVTVMLSLQASAWFYVSLMLASFLFSVPIALTQVLYAAGAAQPALLARKMRLTLGLALAVSVLANGGLLFGAKYLLGLFGQSYVDHAVACLCILCLSSFPLTIRNHYLAICRVQGRVVRALLPMLIGGVLELGGAALGAHLGDLSGLSFGWFLAICVEAMLAARPVYKALRSSNNDDHRQPQFDEKKWREPDYEPDDENRICKPKGRPCDHV